MNQANKLIYNFRIIVLGDYDIILGVDWMKRFGPMILTFSTQQ